jgi:septal ring factor EnvC (AmiA/AmiB activator)
VIHDAAGKIQSVRYDELAPMLLNEMQNERKETTAKINAQAAEIRDLKQQHEQKAAAQDADIRDLKTQREEMQKQLAELNDLKQELHAALRQLKAQGELVAQR